MKPTPSLPLSAALLAALVLTVPAIAQPGGRGAAQAGTPLSLTQQLTLSREMNLPAELTAAQAAAATALNRAAFTVPADPADLAAKAGALAEAELALAAARAAGFERVQRALQPLTPEQAVAYGRGGVGGRGGAASNWQEVYSNYNGFTALFDGRTLNGWEAEDGKWEVQNGTIHRHQTLEPRNFVDFGQYHIHYKQVFADFHLKVEVKLTSGNAGIQYRSRLESALRAQDGEPKRVEAAGGRGGNASIPLRNVAAAIADPLGKPLPANIKTLDDALKAGLLPVGDPVIPYGNGTGHPWQVSGYQFDFLPTPTGNTGSFYEGQGRGVSAQAGEVLLLSADANGNSVRTVLGRTSDLPVQQYFKTGDWNQVEIIARGNTLIHMLNGRVITVVMDDDAGRRAAKGIISLQLEGPADNEVWYRNIYIKTL
jgi:hypothetical protein